VTGVGSENGIVAQLNPYKYIDRFLNQFHIEKERRIIKGMAWIQEFFRD
jgi:hypothetical protein